MISCECYDYVEIACLYRYQVSLSFLDERRAAVIGEARDTAIDAHNAECIVIGMDAGTVWVPLRLVKSMTAVTPNSHFECVLLNGTSG